MSSPVVRYYAIRLLIPAIAILAIALLPDRRSVASDTEGALLGVLAAVGILAPLVVLIARGIHRARQRSAARKRGIVVDGAVPPPMRAMHPLAVGTVLRAERGGMTTGEMATSVLLMAVRSGHFKHVPAQSRVPGFDVDIALRPGNAAAPIEPLSLPYVELVDSILQSSPTASEHGLPLGAVGLFIHDEPNYAAAALDAVVTTSARLNEALDRHGLLARRSRLQLGCAWAMQVVAPLVVVAAVVAALTSEFSDWTIVLTIMATIVYALGGVLRRTVDLPINRGLSPIGRACALRWASDVSQAPSALDARSVEIAIREDELVYQVAAGHARDLRLGGVIDGIARTAFEHSTISAKLRFVMRWLQQR